MSVFSFLKSPYPSNYGEQRSILIGIIVGGFIATFLYIFRPFGLESVDFSFVDFLGFGVVSFIGVFLIYYLAPKLLPSFFDEKTYSVGKELLLSTVLIITIGTGNAIYNNHLLDNSMFLDIGPMIFKTLLIGIFPLTFLTLIEYNNKLRKNLKISEEISVNKQANKRSPEAVPVTNQIVVSTEGEQRSIDTKDLLYIEAVGNYANVALQGQDTVNRNLFRTTLKSLEQDNAVKGVMRCHRSYIVNLEQVSKVKGNAQGLKLHLKDCPDIVPVSRKYIPLVKAYFDQQTV